MVCGIMLVQKYRGNRNCSYGLRTDMTVVEKKALALITLIET